MDKNLSEVIDKALETGEKVVTIECPCCHKVYYLTESEASYQDDNPADQSPLKLKHIGRKCPYCGYASGYYADGSSKMRDEIERMKVEMEAEKQAEKMLDRTKTPWAEINNRGVGWKN